MSNPTKKQKTYICCTACGDELASEEVVLDENGKVTNKHVVCPEGTEADKKACRKAIFNGKQPSQGPAYQRRIMG